MAAFAALVSLTYIIEQIEHHSRPPISLDKEQVQSITQNVTFLQDFLEGYSHGGHSKEADDLETRIADAAYAAEDIIESHIVDQILAGSMNGDQKISSSDLYQGLQKVIEVMGSIKKEVMELKEKIVVQNQMYDHSSISADSSTSSRTEKNSKMVGFDDVFYEVIDKLTRQQSNRQIIPIVGMGGIGKTTLAKNIYLSALVQQHFYIRAWTIASQEHSITKILSEVLSQVTKTDVRGLSVDELGLRLHKHLSGRRYLIVIDDMWSIEPWDQIRRFFPDNNNGSRILITTRLSNMASQLSDSCVLVKFLDEDKSWNLFCQVVFGEESCPLEFEKIGKEIAKSCKGLPLSIVVIGGLIAKSERTLEYWKYIARNLNSMVNSEDNERCLKILYMSYNQLPVCLKPCFLYMGVFQEDREIRRSMLVQLWSVEGFLKPISGKDLEETAEEYLKELIHRNLIFVSQLGCTGNIKFCKIHDLLRDLCLKEAQKERFYNVTGKQSGLNIPRRAVIPRSSSKSDVLDALQSMSLARSLICDIEEVLPLLNFRLLRIFKGVDKDSYKGDEYLVENMFELVNSRYLALRARHGSKLPSSMNLLWNLSTLIANNFWGNLVAPEEIWNMVQLKHVKIGALNLPDPPRGDVEERDKPVLWNLQTLTTVMNFKCSEEVVERIANVKKLKIFYSQVQEMSHYCLNNIGRLQKLESFDFHSYPSIRPRGSDFLQNVTFPNSLKKLSFASNHVHWEDFLEKIGSLPLLEKLTLNGGVFVGWVWETVEGQFCNLKFLLIKGCRDLKYWRAESSHFPRLEHLHLTILNKLDEIPSGIGDIATLQSIKLDDCCASAVVSAKRIVDEQEELGEVSLQVRVKLSRKNEELESLASPNFHVECNATRMRF